MRSVVMPRIGSRGSNRTRSPPLHPLDFIFPFFSLLASVYGAVGILYIRYLHHTSLLI